jgi:cold shock protein
LRSGNGRFPPLVA